MKARLLVLRHLGHLAEHLGGACEVEAAVGLKLAERGERVVRPVDVRVQRREAVGERLGDERLCGEVITLVELVLAEDAEERGVGLKTPGVDGDAPQQVRDAGETTRRVFERDAADDAMHLVAFVEQVLGQVRAVLPRDARDERGFHVAKSG
jgi:hypothetical protein